MIIEEEKVAHNKIGAELMFCKKFNRPLSLGRFQQLGDINKVSYDGDGCGLLCGLVDMYDDLIQYNKINLFYLNEKYFPKTTSNIVALFIVLALITQSAEKSTLIASNLGGNSDSVASMSSAIAGAVAPHTVNNKWYESVQAVNGSELVEIAGRLYLLRNKLQGKV